MEHLNVKFSNSKLNKLKSGIKNGTEVTLNLSSNVIGNSIDETNFPHKFLLTNAQVLMLHKAFANGFSANINLSKTQLHKIRQSGGVLGRLLGSLYKAGLPAMKNELKPLAKSVLIPLGSTAAASAIVAAIQKKIFGSCMARLIVSNEEMNNIMKTIEPLEESGLLIKDVSKKTKNEAKEGTGGFFGMLLGTLGATLLGYLLTDKEVIRANDGKIRTGEGTVRVGQYF